MRKLMLTTMIAALAACNANPPPTAPADSATPSRQTPAPAPAPTPPADTTTPPPADTTTPAFVDKLWRVETSTAVEAGTTYTFLSGGTLLIDAPHGTPMTGRWSYADGKLTMTEEGIAYPTDIVVLDADHFTIRSHNPGGTVEIALVVVPGAPLPSAQ